ncbi:hypothetical protein DENSPDRAFT_852122 [Dentipellis sp. KUC8613]|nr:hypothetical protein DENSPDRAFT_852122 [Dentipellis sp. KUC8613]
MTPQAAAGRGPNKIKTTLAPGTNAARGIPDGHWVLKRREARLNDFLGQIEDSELTDLPTRAYVPLKHDEPAGPSFVLKDYWPWCDSENYHPSYPLAVLYCWNLNNWIRRAREDDDVWELAQRLGACPCRRSPPSVRSDGRHHGARSLLIPSTLCEMALGL